MEELASVNALYMEAKEMLDQAKSDEAELEALRELKADIDRKDKQQAEIISNQVHTGDKPGGSDAHAHAHARAHTHTRAPVPGSPCTQVLAPLAGLC